jgi:hypothetical protein
VITSPDGQFFNGGVVVLGILLAQVILSIDSLFIYFMGILLAQAIHQLTVYLFIYLFGLSCWAQAIISTDSLFIYFMGILLGSGDYIN